MGMTRIKVQNGMGKGVGKCCWVSTGLITDHKPKESTEIGIVHSTYGSAPPLGIDFLAEEAFGIGKPCCLKG